MKMLSCCLVAGWLFASIAGAEAGGSACAAPGSDDARAACGKCATDRVCPADKEGAVPGKCEGGKCRLQKSTDGKQADTEGTINTSGLAALIRAKVPAVILDARSGKWDDGKRIPGARALNAESKAEDIAALLPDKAALVVTYCAGVTCPASHKLAERLKKEGYKNLLEYPQGIAGWLDAGQAIEEKK